MSSTAQALVAEHLEPEPGRYAIDTAHSRVGFATKHLMVATVRGQFTRFSGTVEIDPVIERSSIQVEIDPSSVTTGMDQRDDHLRSADFFEIESFPVMKFKSTKIERTGPTTGRVTGDLAIKGTVKPVTLNVELEGVNSHPAGGTVAALTATGEIDREEFGINWNQVIEAGGVLVSRKVKLEIEVSLRSEQ